MRRLSLLIVLLWVAMTFMVGVASGVGVLQKAPRSLITYHSQEWNEDYVYRDYLSLSGCPMWTMADDATKLAAALSDGRVEPSEAEPYVLHMEDAIPRFLGTNDVPPINDPPTICTSSGGPTSNVMRMIVAAIRYEWGDDWAPSERGAYALREVPWRGTDNGTVNGFFSSALGQLFGGAAYGVQDVWEVGATQLRDGHDVTLSECYVELNAPSYGHYHTISMLGELLRPLSATAAEQLRQINMPEQLMAAMSWGPGGNIGGTQSRDRDGGPFFDAPYDRQERVGAHRASEYGDTGSVLTTEQVNNTLALVPIFGQEVPAVYRDIAMNKGSGYEFSTCRGRTLFGVASAKSRTPHKFVFERGYVPGTTTPTDGSPIKIIMFGDGSSIAVDGRSYFDSDLRAVGGVHVKCANGAPFCPEGYATHSFNEVGIASDTRDTGEPLYSNATVYGDPENWQGRGTNMVQFGYDYRSAGGDVFDWKIIDPRATRSSREAVPSSGKATASSTNQRGLGSWPSAEVMGCTDETIPVGGTGLWTKDCGDMWVGMYVAVDAGAGGTVTVTQKDVIPIALENRRGWYHEIETFGQAAVIRILADPDDQTESTFADWRTRIAANLNVSFVADEAAAGNRPRLTFSMLEATGSVVPFETDYYPTAVTCDVGTDDPGYTADDCPGQATVKIDGVLQTNDEIWGPIGLGSAPGVTFDPVADTMTVSKGSNTEVYDFGSVRSIFDAEPGDLATTPDLVPVETGSNGYDLAGYCGYEYHSDIDGFLPPEPPIEVKNVGGSGSSAAVTTTLGDVGDCGNGNTTWINSWYEHTDTLAQDGVTTLTGYRNDTQAALCTQDAEGEIIVDCDGCTQVTIHVKQTVTNPVPPAVVEDCTTLTDEDGDSFAGCLDSECDGREGPGGGGELCEYGVEFSCDDTYDNDGDGNVDTADGDCPTVALGGPGEGMLDVNYYGIPMFANEYLQSGGWNGTCTGAAPGGGTCTGARPTAVLVNLPAESIVEGDYIVEFDNDGIGDGNVLITSCGGVTTFIPENPFTSLAADRFPITQADDGVDGCSIQKFAENSSLPIANVKIWRPGQQGNVFNADYVTFHDDTPILRTMDPSGTNCSLQVDWANRPQFDGEYAVNSEEGKPVPWESLYDFAVAAGAPGIWVNIPHAANDAYITALGALAETYFQSDGIQTYMEYSNEVWNSGFQSSNLSCVNWSGDGQWGYAETAAQAFDWSGVNTEPEWSGPPYYEFSQHFMWTAHRFSEACTLFEAENSGVQCVLAGQAAGEQVAGSGLWYLEHLSMRLPDIVAINPYVCGSPAPPPSDDTLDEVFEYCANFVTAHTVPRVQNHRTMLNDFNALHGTSIKLGAYEGGQHFPDSGQLFTDAQTDARMRTQIYAPLFALTTPLFDGPWMHFGDVTGHFGSVPYILGAGPKRDHLLSLRGIPTPSTPIIASSVTSINLVAEEGTADAPTICTTITNPEAGTTLEGIASIVNQQDMGGTVGTNWGTIGTGSPFTVIGQGPGTILCVDFFDTMNGAPGVYTETLRLADNGSTPAASTVDIPITVTVNGAVATPPIIELTPTSTDIVEFLNTGTPGSVTFTVGNAGLPTADTLIYTASLGTVPSCGGTTGTGWLASISGDGVGSSFNVQPGGTEGVVSLNYANAEGCELGGPYSVPITITAAGASNTPQVHTASLRIIAAGGDTSCTWGNDCFCDRLADSGHPDYDPTVFFCEDFEHPNLPQRGIQLGDGSGRAEWHSRYGNAGSGCVFPDPNQNNNSGYTAMGRTHHQHCMDIYEESGPHSCETIPGGDTDCVLDGSASMGHRMRAAGSPFNGTAGFKGTETFPTTRNFGYTIGMRYSPNYLAPGDPGGDNRMQPAEKGDEFGSNWSSIMGASNSQLHNHPFSGTLLINVITATQVDVGLEQWDDRPMYKLAMDPNLYMWRREWSPGEWGCWQIEVDNWGLAGMRMKHWFNEVLVSDRTFTQTPVFQEGKDQSGINAYTFGAYRNDGYFGPTTAVRYQDNVVMTSDKPVPCSALGFPF